MKLLIPERLKKRQVVAMIHTPTNKGAVSSNVILPPRSTTSHRSLESSFYHLLLTKGNTGQTLD